MDDAEIKALIRSKGACGEVFVDERGVKVTCLETCEQHHRERDGLRAALYKLVQVASSRNDWKQSTWKFIEECAALVEPQKRGP